MAATKDTGCIDGVITCAICQQLFQDPVVLDCCHTLCRGCLCSDTVEGRLLIQACPLCQKPIEMNVSELRGNSVLGDIIELMKKQNKDRELDVTSKSTCQVCRNSIDNSGGLKCVDCNITYCSICHDKYHPNMGIFSNHKIQNLSQGTNGVGKFTECHLHRKDFVYFCLKCRVAVCYDCHNESHKDHKSEILSKAFDTEYAKMKSEITNAKSMHLNFTQKLNSQPQHLISLENKKALRIACIRKCFESLRQALNEKESELIDKEEDIVGKPLKKYKADLKKVTSDMLCMQSVISVAETVVEVGEIVPLLLMFKPIEDGIKEYSSSISMDVFNDPPEILTPPERIDITHITEEINRLGNGFCALANNDSEGCPVNQSYAEFTGESAEIPTQKQFKAIPIDEPSYSDYSFNSTVPEKYQHRNVLDQCSESYDTEFDKYSKNGINNFVTPSGSETDGNFNRVSWKKRHRGLRKRFDIWN